MNIALPNNGELVNQHFGKSTSFIIATVENKKIETVKEISTIELMHKHEGLADMLVNNQVNVVITGGIGAGALTALEEKGFEIIRGASGEYKKVIEEYINGTLESKNVVCNHHHDENK